MRRQCGVTVGSEPRKAEERVRKQKKQRRHGREGARKGACAVGGEKRGRLGEIWGGNRTRRSESGPGRGQGALREPPKPFGLACTCADARASWKRSRCPAATGTSRRRRGRLPVAAPVLASTTLAAAGASEKQACPGKVAGSTRRAGWRNRIPAPCPSPVGRAWCHLQRSERAQALQGVL